MFSPPNSLQRHLLVQLRRLRGHLELRLPAALPHDGRPVRHRVRHADGQRERPDGVPRLFPVRQRGHPADGEPVHAAGVPQQ